MKLNVAKFFKDVQKGASKHSPELLIGLGIACGIGTTVLAVKATPKAMRLIKEAEEEKGERLTKPEVVKTCWKCYIPAAVTGVTSIACIVGADSVHAKRSAAIATAYKLSEAAFSEYKEKVVEAIGEKKEQAIKEKIVKEKVEKHPVSQSNVIITNNGETLCFDAAIGRYFKSDIEKIKRAVNIINREMTYNMYVSLNEFYDALDLPHVELGDELGWNMDEGLVEVDFSAQMSDDGRPCIAIYYNVAPRYDFAKLM